MARLIKREPTTLSTGCWEWPGRRCTGHYGQVSMSMKLVMVHRVIYEHLRGPVDPTKELDHQCRNRICANPDHLQQVTRQQNSANPLPYQPPPRQLTIFRKCSHGSSGPTSCIICRREYANAWRKRRAANRTPAVACGQGHPLSGENVVLLPHCRGGFTRRCRICLSAAGKKGGRPSHKPKEKLPKPPKAAKPPRTLKPPKPPKEPAAPRAPRTQCASGHELNEANTYTSPQGARQCRICRSYQGMKQRAKLAAGYVQTTHRKTHCNHGHAFEEANTYVDPNGRWFCRQCQREKDKRRRK